MEEDEQDQEQEKGEAPPNHNTREGKSEWRGACLGGYVGRIGQIPFVLGSGELIKVSWWLKTKKRGPLGTKKSQKNYGSILSST